jgi:hypothetical protein
MEQGRSRIERRVPMGVVMQHQFQYPKVTPVHGAPTADKPQGSPRPAPASERSPKQR